MPQQINEDQVKNLGTDLAAKAPLASPALTGIPTAPTATPGTNTTQIATTAFVEAALAGGTGGITQLTGDVTAGPGSGSQAATLAASGVTAGTYTNPTVTFDAKGRATFAVNAGTPVANNAQFFDVSGTTYSITYTPVAGQSMLMTLQAGNTLSTSSATFTDSNSNTWVGLGNNGSIAIWVCYSAKAGTITLNFSSGPSGGVVGIVQYSALLSADVYDIGGTGAINISTRLSNTITTTSANDLLVGIGAGYPGTIGSNCYISTSGYSLDASNPASGANGQLDMCYGSLLVSATGSYSLTAFFNGNANGRNAAILAFKVASSGGTGTGVTSFGPSGSPRTGVVTPQTGDYSFAQLSGSATPSQLPAMVGDSGSGGTAGIVPVPPAGAAAAGKFLKADGTFAVPASATGSNASQLQGVNVSATAPTTGQVLAYNGSLWIPTTGGGGGGSSISFGPRASLPASAGLAGTTYECSDSPYRYVSDGTNWKAYVYGVPVTEPTTAVLSQVYGTTNAPDTSRGGLNIPMPTANDAMYGVAKPSASSWSAVAGFIPRMTQGQFSQCSLILYDSGSTKATMISWLNPWNAGKTYEVTKWTNAVTAAFSASYTIPNAGGSSTIQGYGDNYRGMAGLLWLRVKVTSTNISYYLCHDPWTTDATELILTTTLTDWLPAITHVGVRCAFNVGTMWLQHFLAA